VSAVEASVFPSNDVPGSSGARHSSWEICDLVVGYGLILAVIWTPRSVQRWLYWVAIAWLAMSIIRSFPGWKVMGCSVSGFWRSSWIVALALVLSGGAALIAGRLHTLHHPAGMAEWVKAFGGYSLWAMVQQFLLQGYFLLRLTRILPSTTLAAIAAATVFALAHLPNPILTPVTLLWGLAACFVFLRFRNLWTLAMAHAIFGICLAVTIPGPVLHNMRVGLGYLTYRAPDRHHRNHRDHRVSTVAWVRDEAATRR
jgi:Type II CAAX prenyl endopeptidase Rce1-like